MTPVRVALVGFGKWAPNYLRAARDAGNAEVTQIVLKPDSRSRAAAEATGLPVTWDIGDVRRAGCDAAVIATGPEGAGLIAPVMLEVLGVPVLVEKPAVLTVAGAQALVESETQSGCFVLIGHQHLFAGAYEALRALARCRAASVEALFTGPVMRDYAARLDYGAHAVACLIGIGGPPAGPVVSLAEEFRFIGERGTHCAGAARNAPVKMGVVAAVFDGVNACYDAYPIDGSRAEPPLTRQVRAFADAVRAGGTDDWRFGARWAVDVARVLERHRRDFLDDPTGRP